jgi:hypothetical protein
MPKYLVVYLDEKGNIHTLELQTAEGMAHYRAYLLQSGIIHHVIDLQAEKVVA